MLFLSFYSLIYHSVITFHMNEHLQLFYYLFILDFFLLPSFIKIPSSEQKENKNYLKHNTKSIVKKTKQDGSSNSAKTWSKRQGQESSGTTERSNSYEENNEDSSCLCNPKCAGGAYPFFIEISPGTLATRLQMAYPRAPMLAGLSTQWKLNRMLTQDLNRSRIIIKVSACHIAVERNFLKVGATNDKHFPPQTTSYAV